MSLSANSLSTTHHSANENILQSKLGIEPEMDAKTGTNHRIGLFEDMDDLDSFINSITGQPINLV
jgi:hypothetical protein